MTNKEIKEIREILRTNGDVDFIVQVPHLKNHRGEYREFSTMLWDDDEETKAIYDGFGKGMNVKKFGPTCITLFSYDMLNNRTTGKIRYEDIKLINKD